MPSNRVLRWFGNEEVYYMAAPNVRTTTIPVHPGKILPRGLIHKIISDLELTVEDYIKMK
ncbi:type II toxin-antitoxin system HicA family toxin [Methanosarcina horonobensis]|uniref:type II toxin-antitoxin system HicA family toxin n=1 Tax=Methanosarcina horonobensis TaxID=418008 RepID=UPI00064E2B8A|nr:hypothetical protein [Methanosarcina horonobensis]